MVSGVYQVLADLVYGIYCLQVSGNVVEKKGHGEPGILSSTSHLEPDKERQSGLHACLTFHLCC